MPIPATATHHHPPPPLLPPSPITANPSTATTRLSHPALTPPTSSIHRSSVVVVVEVKNFKNLFCSKWAKKPKKHDDFSLFFYIQAVWVGGFKSLIENYNFFWTLPLLGNLTWVINIIFFTTTFCFSVNFRSKRKISKNNILVEKPIKNLFLLAKS